MAYKPEQRSIECQILTPAGWANGTFHIPRSSRFVEHLNVEDYNFFRLTDFSFQGRDAEIPFFALQRDAPTLIAPPTEETNLHHAMEETRPTRVFCLFPRGVVEGRLRIRKGIRVSDYWVRQSGYVVLDKCKVRLGTDTELWVEENHEHVIINAGKIVGISEEEPF